MVGAIYLDKGLDVAETFIRVMLLSRIQRVILEREWMTPKKKLLQMLQCSGNSKKKPSYK